MSHLADTTHVYCPYCGEHIEIVIDPSIDFQDYVEDCSVCCRPIVLTVQISSSSTEVTAKHEDE